MVLARAVLDTHVVISALRSKKGASFKLLGLVGERFELCLSVALALEYEDVAHRATSLPSAVIETIVGSLCRVAHQQTIFFRWRPTLRDPSDEMILDLAVAAGASYIVTFNHRHFVGADRFGIKVVSPAELLTILGD
ncbi:MAG: putative toxin-antitoxin system toxin component, PIN family [Thermoanaerobaculia bacterium]|nr:putative toxin-antitoxin system toxin component, PIN family [Thermoanaerobaculia bacterium]